MSELKCVGQTCVKSNYGFAQSTVFNVYLFSVMSCAYHEVIRLTAQYANKRLYL